jgi:bifunctional enzyme CysN/CysC
MREQELISQDIEAYLGRHERKEILRFLTAGSVDDGKSTLIGRLLYDSNMVYDDQLDALRRDSAKKSSAGGEIDYSLLVDGLLSEREQGITIDVAYRYFATARRKFIIADTPGHEQYTRNMATGASTADLAILLVDARQGVLAQTRRHATIAALLGIRHIVVAVNKMDLVGFDEAVFDAIRRELGAFAERIGLRDVCFIPLSALRGDNVVVPSESTPYYAGPPLLEYLETIPLDGGRATGALRFPVQLVCRPNLDFRGFAGTIASGVVRKGDTVMALPSRRTSRVASIVTYDGELDEAAAPLAVTLTLEDEIDLSRGEMLVHEAALPHVGRAIEANVVWMNEKPLTLRASYLVKHGTTLVSAEVTAIHHVLDVTTLEEKPATRLALNDIGRVTLTAARPLLFDAYAESRATGAFILVDRLTNATMGAGMITRPGEAAPATGERLSGRVTPDERAARLGQRAVAAVLVEPRADRGAELAEALERRLFDDGYTAYALAPDAGSIADTARLVTSLGLIAIVRVASADGVATVTSALGAERVLELPRTEGEGEAATRAWLDHAMRALTTRRATG